jgi:DNA-binding transcriptional MerR regulator
MIYYFYNMRQLDLFGSFIDTPPEEEKLQEKIPELIKNKTISAVSANEEISYSLVELAEEMLGAKTFNDTEEIIETPEVNGKPAEQSKGKTVLSYSSNTIISENAAEITHIEQLEISSQLAEDELINQEKALSQKPVSILNPELTEEIIFENDEIRTGVENEDVTAIYSTEKIKKEPQKRGRKSLQEIESEADLIEVPEDEVLFKKQYYPISEVARWFKVNNSLLRFWENEFDVLKPKKNRKGDRLFRPEDVKNLQLIYHLLRQRKYTIEGAKEYLKTHRQKADVQLQLTTTLQKFKGFLLDLKANL